MRNPSSSLSIPDPTPALFLVAIATVLIWVVGDAGWLSLLILGVAVAPFLLSQLFSRPMANIAVLVIGASMPRFFAEIGGVKARPEHIAVGLVGLATLYWWRKNRELTVWMKADVLLLLYVACNYVSSTFMSISPGQTIKWATQQLLVILPYFFLRVFLTSDWRFRKALEIVLLAGVMEAAYALLCFYSNRFFGTTFGMEQDQYGIIPGTYGTQLEANILGSTSAACLVMLLTLYFNERFSTVDVNNVAADDNTRSRVLTIAIAYDNIVEHPILGNGTASFQLSFEAKDFGYFDLDQAGWIGNTEIRVLYDMGLVGIVVFSLFLWNLARPAWKLIKQEHSAELLGLLLSAVAYCISFQFTEGTLLAFSWVHLGLIGCGVALLKNKEHIAFEGRLLPGTAGSHV